MKLYFAYSSALDETAFNEWKTQHGFHTFSLPEGRKAVAQGERLVFDFPSKFWGGRALGLESDSMSRAQGFVFKIDEANWGIIQHKEGVVTGSAIEKKISVLIDGSANPVEATAFVTNPNRRSIEGPVSERFVEAVRRAYQSRGLGEQALHALEQARNI